MPFVHSAHFPIRHYECNADGDVHHANYLRYMQEAAFGGSAAVGYGAARYVEIGLQWLAYETEVHYLQPLHYGDVLEIKTWVQDFRRVRSLRRYEFFRAGEMIAHASTDWVLLDMKTNYPTTIPQEIIDAYSQGDPVDQADPRKPIPRLPPVPENAFTHSHAVEWRDIDGAQHVNNAIYLHYVSHCERLSLASFNQSEPTLKFRTNNHLIEYKFPAMLGDEVKISTWIADVDGATLKRHFRVTRASDDKLLTRISAEQTLINSTTHQPQPISSEIQDRLHGN
ncbi:MAG: thioesterase family protein [Aggregatilineales bacterium]